MVLLLFTAVVTPVEVAFLPSELNALFFVNRFVDFCFIIDIVFNFFVAIPDPADGQLIFHHPTIIRSYLRGWFTIDVVSILPFDIGGIIFDSDAVSRLKFLRILRLLRLMKLLRILRAARIFKRLETLYTIDYSLLELFKFGVMTVVCSHWLACAFGLVEDLEESDYSWVRYTTFNSWTDSGRAVQVDPIKPTLKAPGTERLKLALMDCFQNLLSSSTCAATQRAVAAGG
jgi:hypothetical protein